MDDELKTTCVVDNVLRGMALERIRAFVIDIDVALTVFGAQLSDLRIDDDLRMVRSILYRVAGRG